MANPQPTDAHLRVAHSINEAIMLRDFKKRQRKILDLIFRLSWGCGKKTAYIPRQRDFEVIGIKETHISTELSWLVESKIITINGCEYAFNKDFDQWQVSRVNPYSPQKLTELVRLNLNNNQELTELVSSALHGNLLKREVGTSHNSKFFKAKLATPKERGGEGRGEGTPPLPIKEKSIDIINNDINEIIYNMNGSLNEKETIIQGQSVNKIKQILKGEVPALEANKAIYRKALKRLGIEELDEQPTKRERYPKRRAQ